MTQKRKAFKTIRIPPETTYTTYMGYSNSHLELALSLISQGYGSELYTSMANSYIKQAQGVYKVLLSLIYDIENEEVEY